MMDTRDVEWEPEPKRPGWWRGECPHCRERLLKAAPRQARQGKPGLWSLSGPGGLHGISAEPGYQPDEGEAVPGHCYWTWGVDHKHRRPDQVGDIGRRTKKANKWRKEEGLPPLTPWLRAEGVWPGDVIQCRNCDTDVLVTEPPTGVDNP